MIISSINKRKYIYSPVFHDGTRDLDYLIGNHVRAVAILACQCGPGLGAACSLWDQYAGSWSGDQIVVAFDDGDPPNPDTTFGVQTTTQTSPKRNLFGMIWEEFEDISYPNVNSTLFL